MLGAFQQYLRNQNFFCIWNTAADKMEPMFSNNNYHPKSTMIENSVFSNLGRGNWESCTANVQEGLEWCGFPWESVSKNEIERINAGLAMEISGKSAKVTPGDLVMNGQVLDCRSSSDLCSLSDDSFGLVSQTLPSGASCITLNLLISFTSGCDLC